jgi:hypothetical protein
MTSARKVWQVNVPGGLYSSPAVVGRRDGGMVIFVTADNQKWDSLSQYGLFVCACACVGCFLLRRFILSHSHVIPWTTSPHSLQFLVSLLSPACSPSLHPSLLFIYICGSLAVFIALIVLDFATGTCRWIALALKLFRCAFVFVCMVCMLKLFRCACISLYPHNYLCVCDCINVYLCGIPIVLCMSQYSCERVLSESTAKP